MEKDPKKILDNLKQQQEKIRQLEETENDKAKEIKEKVAWKTVLQKAEGQKVKDDPILLKKSIKKMVSVHWMYLLNQQTVFSLKFFISKVKKCSLGKC